jgi:hypothetical protein
LLSKLISNTLRNHPAPPSLPSASNLASEVKRKWAFIYFFGYVVSEFPAQVPSNPFHLHLPSAYCYSRSGFSTLAPSFIANFAQDFLLEDELSGAPIQCTSQILHAIPFFKDEKHSQRVVNLIVTDDLVACAPPFLVPISRAQI